MTTPVLGLPEVTDGQASQGAIHNEALRELMAKTVRVLSRTTAGEPGSPADGDAYILPSGFSGASWGGSAVNRIAHFIGGVWQFYTPAEGWRVWVNDENIQVVYDGSIWSQTNAISNWPCVAVSTTPFSVTATHKGSVLVCDTTASSITLNLLPAATAGNGFVVAIKKKVAGNSLIIDPNGAELIDDATTLTLTDDEDSRIIVSDGSEWHAIGGGGSGGGGSTQPFSDATAMFKNDADPTKTVKVDLSALATGTERTAAYPNKSGTHAFLDDVAPGGNGSDQFAEDSANHNGLLYAYKAGTIRADNVVTLVAAGTVLLTEGATNYVEITGAGVVSANTTGFTSGRFPMAIVTTLGGSPSGIDVVSDRRAWASVQVDAGYDVYGERLVGSTAAGTDLTFNVNSTSYVLNNNFAFLVDLDTFLPTHFLISVIQGDTTEVGQTVTLQLTTAASASAVLHTGGNDIVIDDTQSNENSGWRTFDNPSALTGIQALSLALKGSTATVDLVFRSITIYFRR